MPLQGKRPFVVGYVCRPIGMCVTKQHESQHKNNPVKIAPCLLGLLHVRQPEFGKDFVCVLAEQGRRHAVLHRCV